MRFWWWLAGAVLITGLDRGVKALVLHGSAWQLGPLTVKLVKNPGLVFGLPIGDLAMIILLLAAFIGVISLAAHWWQSAPARSMAALVIATGAASNLIDRWHYGFVVDWMYLGDWWPVANGADLIIAAGLIWMLWPVIDKPTTTS